MSNVSQALAHRQLTLSKRIPLYLAIASLVSVLSVGLFSYYQAASELTDASQSKVSALVSSRTESLARYLDSIEQDLLLTASDPAVHDAMTEFSDAWRDLKFEGEPQEILQDLFITGSEFPTGEKQKLIDPGDGSLYSEVHRTFHQRFWDLQATRGYYDIFFISPEGDVIYTVFKELDYATNLISGSWKDTDLANVFRHSVENPTLGQVSFFDFKPYAPSNDAPASFISTPVLNDANRLLGVLVFQMPIDKLNAIMQQSQGMGETGETYIVGNDFLMRSDSRFSEESTILQQQVETDATRAALAGETGTALIEDYRGVPVLSAYGSLVFNGTTWAVIGEIDEAEALAGVAVMQKIMLAASAVILLLVVVFGFLGAKGITKPLVRLTEAMKTLADGDTSVDIPAQGRKDELGDMAEAMLVFKNNAIERAEMQAQEAENQRKQAERAEVIATLCSDFDSSVGTTLKNVSSAATQLDSTANSMVATAEQTDSLSNSAAAASEEATTNVQTVAAASEELSASIDEIGRQVAQSTSSTAKAVAQSETTAVTVKGLAEAADRIGDVVTLIQDIAEQTNLLALNATIEAARAGEAGKGFAVVANEVKSLATQTAKATSQISDQITAIQSETTDAVEAIDGIKSVVDEVSHIATSIASAIEEQAAATGEISTNVQQAASGTKEVSGNISGVAEGSAQTRQSATQVLDASGELARSSEELRSQVESFLANIRAA
ncbi:methyl-accepting chemotaxis protein [Rhodovibrionaceae bacterium A322]